MGCHCTAQGIVGCRVPFASPLVLELVWSTFLCRWTEFTSLQNELGFVLLGEGALVALAWVRYPSRDRPNGAGVGQSHTADFALFTAELFFSPNKILSETVNMPEASPRGETGDTEEISVLRARLPLPSLNPEQTFRDSSKYKQMSHA